MKIIKDLFVRLASAFLILFFLKLTGLLSGFQVAAQTVMLKTGLLDASDEVSQTEQFDYRFTLVDMEGREINFDQFKGKVVFLNLWATWCPPCRAEMESIQELYDDLPPNTAVFVMLSVDKSSNKNKVKQYVLDEAFTFPVYMTAGEITDQLNVPSIPTTYIIGKDGKIVSKEVGTTNFNSRKFKKFLTGLSK